MKLNVLESFLAISRSRSISGAAELLHISQPALSRQIKELEEELGTKLFKRGSREMTLTAEGTLFRKRARQILDLVKKTSEELSQSEKNISGTIYIAGGETHSFRTVARTIKNIAAEYPDIHFNLFSGNADDVTEQLDREGADFGLVIEPADVSRYDYMRLPAVDRWGVLMRKDCYLATKEAISPKEIWELPLIYSRQAVQGGQLSSWLKKDPEKLNIVATYNLLFNASLLVEAGLGYALCLDKIINTECNSELCFRPLKPELNSHVDLIWKKHQVFSPAAELFLERIREEI
ncbi:LysR family transcriptional regulator [Maridesulfovibrio bastinii]|uniref:LysR family transcriptional regulator n=1 Tax=Maridesulfovibrio bastinii TaxID=47157 RepID=UPI0003F6AE6C|nr:LysR family transcriptional regulator [Maridesulfovibrio bastinii]